MCPHAGTRRPRNPERSPREAWAAGAGSRGGEPAPLWPRGHARKGPRVNGRRTSARHGLGRAQSLLRPEPLQDGAVTERRLGPRGEASSPAAKRAARGRSTAAAPARPARGRRVSARRLGHSVFLSPQLRPSSKHLQLYSFPCRRMEQFSK